MEQLEYEQFSLCDDYFWHIIEKMSKISLLCKQSQSKSLKELLFFWNYKHLKK